MFTAARTNARTTAPTCVAPTDRCAARTSPPGDAAPDVRDAGAPRRHRDRRVRSRWA